MAIQSINTLTDNNIQNLANEFNYYALANLGQRMGAAGSSIKTEYFTIADLLNLKTADISEGEIGIVKYYKNKILLSTNNINDNTEIYIKNINKYINAEETIKLPISRNNVDYYNAGTIIGYDKTTDRYFYSAIGSVVEDNVSKYQEYLLGCVDNATNKIKTLYMVVNASYNENTGKLFHRNNIEQYTDANIKYIPTIFELSLDENLTNEALKTDIDSEGAKYILRIYKVTNENVAYTSLVNNIIDIYVNYNLDNLYDLSTFKSAFLSDILSDIELLVEPNTGNNYWTLTYNSLSEDASQLFTIDDEQEITTELEEYIDHFSQDITYVYPYFKEYYTTNKYTYTIDNLKEQIFVSLLKRILVDSGLSLPTTYYDYITLYWPLTEDGQINYYVSDNETDKKIFGSSKDIYVQYVVKDMPDASDVTMPTMLTTTNQRVSLYGFTFDYDISTELLKDINIYKSFTLPYINSDDYWTVNDLQTSIYAKGLHAGQPNIIIIYNDYDEALKTRTSENSGAHPIVLRASNYDDIFSLIDADNFNINYWKNYTFNYVFNINTNKINNTVVTNSSQVDELYDNFTQVFEEDVENASYIALCNQLNKLQKQLDSHIATFTELLQNGPVTQSTTSYTTTYIDTKVKEKNRYGVVTNTYLTETTTYITTYNTISGLGGLQRNLSTSEELEKLWTYILDNQKAIEQHQSYIENNYNLIEKYHNIVTYDDSNEIYVTHNTTTKNTNNYYILNTRLPDYAKLGEYSKQLLKNSIIINITNVLNETTDSKSNQNRESLSEVLQSPNYEHGNITTFWVIKDGEYTFVPNPDNTDLALDFNYISMADEYIEYIISKKQQTGPDNFSFTQLVFDNIYTNYKNSVDNDEEILSYVLYPNIRNVNSQQYNTYYYSKTLFDGNYSNPANLVIEYNSYLTGTLSYNISNLSQSDNCLYYSDITSDNKYKPLLWDSKSVNTYILPNSYVVNYVNTYEYIFNGILPNIDLKEVVLRNTDALNRLNIVSLDKNAHLYYSYIGTAFDNSNKSTLHIGTSNVNNSWGTHTLSKTNTNFKTHDSIALDFKNIYSNGTLYVNDNKTTSVYYSMPTTIYALNYNEDYTYNKNTYTISSNAQHKLQSQISYIDTNYNSASRINIISTVKLFNDLNISNINEANIKIITNLPYIKVSDNDYWIILNTHDIYDYLLTQLKVTYRYYNNQYIVGIKLNEPINWKNNIIKVKIK